MSDAEQQYIYLPTFREACDAVENKEENPLEEFLYYHQPCNHRDFRDRLMKMLEFVCKEKGAIY